MIVDNLSEIPLCWISGNDNMLLRFQRTVFNLLIQYHKGSHGLCSASRFCDNVYDCASQVDKVEYVLKSHRVYVIVNKYPRSAREIVEGSQCLKNRSWPQR